MNYLKGIRLREKPKSSSYLASLPVIKQLEAMGELRFSMPVTFLVGENGAGKSTLLEAIAVSIGFNPEGGSRDFSFSTSDSHSELHSLITTIKTVSPKDGFFLRAESFYNTATFLDHSSTLIRYGGKSFHAQSHGEGFLSLVKNRFAGHGLYILDEPESALSLNKLLALMVSIDELVKQDSQFLIATHSPILMAYPRAEIYELSENGIDRVPYKETEHYIITKQFLNNPEGMLRHLLLE